MNAVSLAPDGYFSSPANPFCFLLLIFPNSFPFPFLSKKMKDYTLFDCVSRFALFPWILVAWTVTHFPSRETQIFFFNPLPIIVVAVVVIV